MTSLIEVTEDDYGTAKQVTFYTAGDDVTVEDLSGATSVKLDITRKEEAPLVSNADCTITDAGNGVISFTPLATWFTKSSLKGMSHYLAVFKIVYATGQKKTIPIPLYVYLS